MCCREINNELKELKRNLNNLVFSDFRVIENHLEYLSQINTILKKQNDLLRLRHKILDSRKAKILSFESKFLSE